MISRVYWIRTVDFTRTIVGLFYLRAPRRDETFQTQYASFAKLLYKSCLSARSILFIFVDVTRSTSSNLIILR